MTTLSRRPATLPVRKSTAPAHKRSKQTIGLDLGDKFSYWCVLDEHTGEDDILEEGRVRTTPAAIRRHFASLEPSTIAIEASTHSAWVERELSTLGHTVVVANPRELRKIHASDRKNDRADAQVLARMARFDPKLLAPIRHRSAQMQADLASIRARDVAVQARTKFINAIRGLVKTSGARLPKCDAQYFTRKVDGHIPEELHSAIQPLLEVLAHLSELIKKYDHHIEQLADQTYRATSALRQVSGVGALTATAYILTLAEPTRFPRSRDVGPFLGIVPRQDDSGERRSQLRITKSGNGYLRRLLVGSAHYILGPHGSDCDLRRFGQQLAQRGGKNAKKRAIVAVARKLAVLLHHLWLTGEVYEPLRAAARTKAA
jgi:transposase